MQQDMTAIYVIRLITILFSVYLIFTLVERYIYDKKVPRLEQAIEFERVVNDAEAELQGDIVIHTREFKFLEERPAVVKAIQELEEQIGLVPLIHIVGDYDVEEVDVKAEFERLGDVPAVVVLIRLQHEQHQEVEAIVNTPQLEERVQEIEEVISTCFTYSWIGEITRDKGIIYACRNAATILSGGTNLANSNSATWIWISIIAFWIASEKITRRYSR